MTVEAETIQALDQANALRRIAGSGVALTGFALYFWFLVRSRQKRVPILAWITAFLLILGGLILANDQTYV